MHTATQRAYKGMGMEGWMARWYTNTTGKDMEQFQKLAREIAAELQPGSKILEVAPGPGFLAIELAKLGNFEVTGLDISKTFVQIARANAAREGVTVDFQRGNAAAIPFEHGTFDRVLCRAAFKNFHEPVEALREMRRVLKPGGKALVLDLRKDAPMSVINEHVDQMHLSRPSTVFTKWTFRLLLLKRAYSNGQFMDFVKQSGFTKSRIDIADIGFAAWLEK
ncbi:MAG TPA: class I SAM-dependent methyltransferase [Bryobacteraceae bacterium]|nr:class I SAM-dependent methyltransferase [Bryobacteraceae bacterium]